MRRIAFINEKGGTCKTTLCVNIGAWLASRRGQRVLIADLDTQGHAGKSLGVDVRSMSPTVKELLLGHCPEGVHLLAQPACGGRIDCALEDAIPLTRHPARHRHTRRPPLQFRALAPRLPP